MNEWRSQKLLMGSNLCFVLMSIFRMRAFARSLMRSLCVLCKTRLLVLPPSELPLRLPFPHPIAEPSPEASNELPAVISFNARVEKPSLFRNIYFLTGLQFILKTETNYVFLISPYLQRWYQKLFSFMYINIIFTVIIIIILYICTYNEFIREYGWKK